MPTALKAKDRMFSFHSAREAFENRDQLGKPGAKLTVNGRKADDGLGSQGLANASQSIPRFAGKSEHVGIARHERIQACLRRVPHSWHSTAQAPSGKTLACQASSTFVATPRGTTTAFGCSPLSSRRNRVGARRSAGGAVATRLAWPLDGCWGHLVLFFLPLEAALKGISERLLVLNRPVGSEGQRLRGRSGTGRKRGTGLRSGDASGQNEKEERCSAKHSAWFVLHFWL
jgi:hypothetical protein